MAHCKAHNSQIPPLFRPLSALESCQEKTPSRQKAENTPFPKCALNSLIAQSQDLSVFFADIQNSQGIALAPPCQRTGYKYFQHIIPLKYPKTTSDQTRQAQDFEVTG